MGSQVRILSIRLGDQPSLFRLADYTSPPCDVSEKSTAMRMWCSGSTPASQAGNRGFEPRHPLYPENQNNGSDPTMGLVTVLSIWTLPEKTWTNSLGMGTQRQGIRKHAIAPLVQRSEYRTFNPFVVVGSNPTGGHDAWYIAMHKRINLLSDRLRQLLLPAARETREGKHTVRRTRDGPITQIP